MTTNAKEKSIWFYRILLAVAALVWGFGFGLAKDAIEIAGATWVIGIRFLLSGLVLLIIFLPRIKRNLNKDLLRAGIIIGFFSFLGFWTQFIGLGLTTASKNAFLSACYCITVPFIWWIVSRKHPGALSFITAAVCAVGIGFVSLNEGLGAGITFGDGISIFSAFAYGLEIVVIELAMKDHELFTLTTVQQLTAGILGMIVAALTQPIPDIQTLMNSNFCLDMAYVVVLSAAFGSIVQNVAQKHLSACETGLLCSLESVFCAVFSVMFFGETLTVKLIIGFVLIFGAIVAAQLGGAEDLRDRS